MQANLPARERVARDVLDGVVSDYGNWVPGAMLPVAAACQRADLGESDYQEMVRAGRVWGIAVDSLGSEHRVLSAMSWAWEHAEPFGGSGASEEGRAVVAALLPEVLTAPGIPEGARALAVGLLCWCYRTGYTEGLVSTRLGAVLAGTADWSGTSARMRRLQDVGLLGLGDRASARSELPFRLVSGWSGTEKCTDPTRHTRISCGNSAPFAELVPCLEHDVWSSHPSALGPTAGRVYAWSTYFTDAPVSVAGLAAGLALSKRTATKAVKALTDSGLLTRSGRGLYVPVPGADLDAAAPAAVGYRDTLRERFRDDRDRAEDAKAAWKAEQLAMERGETAEPPSYVADPEPTDVPNHGTVVEWSDWSWWLPDRGYRRVGPSRPTSWPPVVGAPGDPFYGIPDEVI